MKVFIAILALVGAVAASHIPEHVEVSAVPSQRAVLDEMRVMSVFAAPKFARDAYLPSEKYGIRGIFEKPVVVAFKSADKKALEAFLLKDGLVSAFTMPEYALMREAILSGPAKVGMMLSAARFLDIPEMALPVPTLKMPVDGTLATTFRLNAMEADKFPWLLVTEKDNIRTNLLDKLVELGQFNVNAEKLAIAREAPIAAPEAILDESALSALSAAGLRRTYLADSIAPVTRIAPIAPAVPIAYRIAPGTASGIAATRAEGPVFHVRGSALENTAFPIEYAAHKHAKHFIPTLSAANGYYVL